MFHSKNDPKVGLFPLENHYHNLIFEAALQASMSQE